MGGGGGGGSGPPLLLQIFIYFKKFHLGTIVIKSEQYTFMFSRDISI